VTVPSAVTVALAVAVLSAADVATTRYALAAAEYGDNTIGKVDEYGATICAFNGKTRA